MTNKRRGMLGALMDEYERAARDYNMVLGDISLADFTLVRDPATTDPDCHSIQTVATHVVRSGYTYASYINSVYNGEWFAFEKIPSSAEEGVRELDAMLRYTDNVLSDKYALPLEEVAAWKFDTRWGVTYDVEQLLEHAIVHILRHRRQIENFLALS